MLASAGKTLEATYTKPYLAHASIGPSAAIAEFKDGKLSVWTHSQGVFPLRAELVKALKMQPQDIRCIHVEGSGCYGQTGADDVALDAALLARAVPGRPVRLQWMRDDEFAWEPYGAAMSMNVRASLDADNKIADWHYELWSNTHSMRPQSTNGTNVLAAWYMAEPQMHGPPQGIPQPAGGGDRNAVPLYDFPNQKIVHHFIPQMPIRVSALRTLGAYANVFALGILHGRDGGAGEGRSGGVPARAYEGPAGARGDREGRRDRELETGRGGELEPRPRHRLLQVQEPRLLRRLHRRRRGRPRDRQGPRLACLVGGRFRTGHQSGRAEEPDRGRHHPDRKLDALRAGAVRQERHHRRATGRAIRS